MIERIMGIVVTFVIAWILRGGYDRAKAKGRKDDIDWNAICEGIRKAWLRMFISTR